VSGETFVVGGSRAARVVLGTVPGLTEITSVDNALERFPDAMHTFDITVHTDAIAEVLDECARTGLDLSSFVSLLRVTRNVRNGTDFTGRSGCRPRWQVDPVRPEI
jgi:hypothetical protein